MIQTPIESPYGLAHCRVTYRMTDQMGMVYHGNFLELFEIGRVELMRAGGLTYREMEDSGIRLPVTHAACDYLSPARYDDMLEIETRVVKLSRAKIQFEYEVRRQGEGRALARGRTHHVFFSPEGRIMRLNARWHERLKALGPMDREETKA